MIVCLLDGQEWLVPYELIFSMKLLSSHTNSKSYYRVEEIFLWVNSFTQNQWSTLTFTIGLYHLAKTLLLRTTWFSTDRQVWTDALLHTRESRKAQQLLHWCEEVWATVRGCNTKQYNTIFNTERHKIKQNWNWYSCHVMSVMLPTDTVNP